MKMVIFHGYVNVYWRYDEFLTWESTEIRAGPCEAGTSVGLLAGSKWWTIHLGPTEAEAANRSSDHVRSPRVRQLESPCVFFHSKDRWDSWWWLMVHPQRIWDRTLMRGLDHFGYFWIYLHPVKGCAFPARKFKNYQELCLTWVVCHLPLGVCNSWAICHVALSLNRNKLSDVNDQEFSQDFGASTCLKLFTGKQPAICRFSGPENPFAIRRSLHWRKRTKL